jgi:hypothetical protein
MATIAFICIFVMPVVYLLGLRHDISSAIATSAFGIGGMIVLGIIFGMKEFTIFKSFHSSSLSKISDSSLTSQSVDRLQNLSPNTVRTLSPDDQYSYYTKQIQKYTYLRLQISDGGSTHSQVEISKSRAYSAPNNEIQEEEILDA